MDNPEDYDLVIKGDHLVIRKKWCDCKPPGFGLVKIAEGRWARPCCRRAVNKAQYEKWQQQDKQDNNNDVHSVNTRKD